MSDLTRLPNCYYDSSIDLLASLDELKTKTDDAAKGREGGPLHALSDTLQRFDVKLLNDVDYNTAMPHSGTAEDCEICSTLFAVSQSRLNASTAEPGEHNSALYVAGNTFDTNVQVWSEAAHDRLSELVERAS